MEKIVEFDRAITCVINGWNTPFMDEVMSFMSKVYVWVPLYLLIAALLVWRLGWKRGLLAVAIAIAAFAITDISLHQLKNSIGRLRPCEDPALLGIIRTPAGHGSLYGFPSGHAANTMGFACLTTLILRRKWRWSPLYSALTFVWALIISYSRIYLGMHFFLDVIVGAITGLLAGTLFFLLYSLLIKRFKWFA